MRSTKLLTATGPHSESADYGLRYLLLLCVLLLPGCGPRDNKVEIAGKVSYDNQPVEKGTIRFEPADGKGPAEELPIINGQFKQMRVTPGKKIVRIVGFKKVGEYRPTGPDSPLMDQLEPYIPAKYNDQSTLEREIQPGKQEPIDFDLEK
jgi:hypothetical protein